MAFPLAYFVRKSSRRESAFPISNSDIREQDRRSLGDRVFPYEPAHPFASLIPPSHRLMPIFPLIVCVILLVLHSTRAEGGRLTVTWLDMPVHGLAVVLETPSGKTYLIDAVGIL